MAHTEDMTMTKSTHRAIDPKSIAGILLREHDNVEQALAYAERKAAALLAMHNAFGLDYAQAAEDLREEQARRR